MMLVPPTLPSTTTTLPIQAEPVTIPTPPTWLGQVPDGAVLQGVVLGRDSSGLVQVRTAQGPLGLTLGGNPAAGASISLQVQSASPGQAAQVQIVALGRAPTNPSFSGNAVSLPPPTVNTLPPPQAGQVVMATIVRNDLPPPTPQPTTIVTAEVTPSTPLAAPPPNAAPAMATTGTGTSIPAPTPAPAQPTPPMAPPQMATLDAAPTVQAPSRAAAPPTSPASSPVTLPMADSPAPPARGSGEQLSAQAPVQRATATPSPAATPQTITAPPSPPTSSAPPAPTAAATAGPIPTAPTNPATPVASPVAATPLTEAPAATSAQPSPAPRPEPTMPVAGSAPAGLNRPAGESLPVRLLTITPPPTTPGTDVVSLPVSPRVPTAVPSANAATMSVTVVGSSAAGQPVIASGGAVMTLATGPLPLGSKIELMAIAPAPRPSLTPAPQPTAPFPAYPSLPAVVAAANDAGETTRAAIMAALPKPGPALAGEMLRFLNAARKGDLGNLIQGETRTSLEKTSKGSQALRGLAREFSESARPTIDNSSGDWRGFTLPMAHQGAIEPVRLYLHKINEDESQRQADGERGQRFMLDLDLTRLGAVQIDGLAKKNRLDVVLRTPKALDGADRQSMEQFFNETLSARGLTGMLIFQVAPPIRVITPPAPTAQRAGVLA